MSDQPRKITRGQLAKFLPDHRAIRAFEQILQQVSTILPEDIASLTRRFEESYIEASTASAKGQLAIDEISGARQDALLTAYSAEAKASEALDALNRIADSLALLAQAPIRQGHNSLAIDYIDLSTTSPNPSEKVGRLKWGKTGTLEVSMGGGNITQQVGEEIFVYGKATSSITDGQLIMVTGAVGASGTLTFAPTSVGLTDPNAILGIATESIPLNGFGRVTIIGIVRGIDTTGSSVGESWVDGDVLWYNPLVVGGMTKTKPSSPNMKTQVAIVINAGSGGSGSLQVEVLHGSFLGGTDTNVQFGSLVDGQIIQYDAALGYWKNVAPSALTTGSLSGGTAGSLPYQSGPSVTAMLGVGTAGQFLRVNSGASAPEWATTLGTANGGTGLGSYSANSVFYASSTTVMTYSSNFTFDGSTQLGVGSGTAGLTKYGRDYYGTAGQNGNEFSVVSNGDQAYRAILGTNNGSGYITFKTASGTVGSTERFRITSLGDMHPPAGSTSMSSGFFRIPAASGPPSGAPSTIAGTLPMYYDSTNDKFYIYNGAWKSVALM